MPVRTFDFCALQFLNQWLEKEAGYSNKLVSKDIDERLEALTGAAAHFRVARNLPTKYEKAKSVRRYEPVLNALEDLGPVTSDNVFDVLANAQQRISSEYGQRNVLSLTTKFLWLKFKSPVRIYDRQARTALGTAGGDYPAFHHAFSKRYAECQEQVEKSCANLVSAVSYSVQPSIDRRELKSLVMSSWFRERVLDIYLWNQGNF